MFKKDCCSWFQDRQPAGQSSANQQNWRHHCDNLFKKRRTIPGCSRMREEWEKNMRKNPEDSKVSKEGGWVCVLGSRAGIILHSLEKPKASRVSACTLWKDPKQIPTLQVMKVPMPHTEGGCALKEAAAHGKATQKHVLWYDL